MKRTLGVAAAGTLAALLLVAPGATAKTHAARPSSAPPLFRSADGITVKTVKQLDSRLYALTVTTAAIPATLNIRVLVPADYASHPRNRYPVLYLFHGTSGTASDWTTMGGAEQTTAGKELIVVMPDIAINDGGGGWCSDWPDGAQKWETFHIDQLVPWAQANLRTLDTRGERAIAGLSQGGFCSMSYAAQYPDLFGEALAFSGAPDIAYDATGHFGAMAIINATEVGLDGEPPDTFFGNPVTDYLNWAAHDPATLAPNLRDTKLYIYYGNGLPGPYDSGVNAGGSGIEGAVDQDNIEFHARLVSLGIKPVVYDPYGNGTHSWPYWKRDLQWAIGPLMDDFADPAGIPAAFTYTSDLAGYSQYGWQVTVTRQVAEFSTLSVTAGDAFSLAGSGTATVTTAANYLRRHFYSVTVAAKAGTMTTKIRSDGHGRLTIPVPLGPSDTTQEYSLGGPPEPSRGTTVYTTHVTVAG